MMAVNGRLYNGGNKGQRMGLLEWIGGAGNNQPTKYWLDLAATLAATDEKNEADGAKKCEKWTMGKGISGERLRATGV